MLLMREAGRLQLTSGSSSELGGVEELRRALLEKVDSNARLHVSIKEMKVWNRDCEGNRDWEV